MANKNDWENLLEEILENEDSHLYGKSLDFIEDLDKRWRGRELSDRQWEWLQKIWDENCG